jgi:hypothetical protein
VSRSIAAPLAVLAALSLPASHARAAVIVPAPDFKSVADRVHALTVLVRGRAFVAGHDEAGHLRVDEGTSAASGVLVGAGLVVTELSSVTLPGKDGKPEPVSGIEVVIPEVGSVPAEIASVDADAGIAVLRLPDETRELPGAVLALREHSDGDAFIAIGADGTRLRAVPVLAGRSGGDGLRLRIDRELPDLFRGGPLFDGQGRLAGLIVGGNAAIPVSRLRPILDRLLGSDGI